LIASIIVPDRISIREIAPLASVESGVVQAAPPDPPIVTFSGQSASAAMMAASEFVIVHPLGFFRIDRHYPSGLPLGNIIA
jgi:hypothetical protein